MSYCFLFPFKKIEALHQKPLYLESENNTNNNTSHRTLHLFKEMQDVRRLNLQCNNEQIHYSCFKPIKKETDYWQSFHAF